MMSSRSHCKTALNLGENATDFTQKAYLWIINHIACLFTVICHTENYLENATELSQRGFEKLQMLLGVYGRINQAGRIKLMILPW